MASKVVGGGIKILDPTVVCTLGKDAVKALVDTKIELNWGETYINLVE